MTEQKYCEYTIRDESGFDRQVMVPAIEYRNVCAAGSPPVRLHLQLQHATCNPRWTGPSSKEPRMLQPLYWDAVVQPGETVLIPASLRDGVQREECLEPGCGAGHKRYICRNPDHPHTIVGGEAPTQLVRITPDGEVRPELGSSLVPSKDRPAASVDERLLARARGAQ